MEVEVRVIDPDKFRSFVRTQKPELADYLSFKDALTIDWRNLDKYNREWGEYLIDNPENTITSIQRIVQELIPNYLNNVIVPKITVVNLPITTPINKLRHRDMNRLVQIEGIIRKATEIRPRGEILAYQCNRCGNVTEVLQPIRGIVQPSPFCLHCEKRAIYSLIQKRCLLVNSQKIQVENTVGSITHTLDIELVGDLCEKRLIPGDQVKIVGIMRAVMRDDKKSAIFDIFMQGNSILISERLFDEVSISTEDEDQIISLSKLPDLKNRIISSIAPTIYGNNEFKEAIALQLFGGIIKVMPDSTELRGDIHILVVGDPGTGKSQLIKFATGLSPRGIFTSGKGTSVAGLTAAAVKDEFGDGRWSLEAGALVRADGGICALDELEKSGKEVMAALHEAMAQQSISVAKAGIVATLRCRCGILAACNPKFGRFDPMLSPAEQINLVPSLLSRFDVIFVYNDLTDPDTDKLISNHILTSHQTGTKIIKGEEIPKNNSIGLDKNFLKKYIAYAKRTVFPTLSDEAKGVITEYYLMMRSQKSNTKPVPITARSVEAINRLSEAHARMRLSPIITKEDAEAVIKLVDTSLRMVAYDAVSGVFDAGMIDSTSAKTMNIIRAIYTGIRDISGEGETAKTLGVIELIESRGFQRGDIVKKIDQMIQSGNLIKPRVDIIRILDEEY